MNTNKSPLTELGSGKNSTQPKKGKFRATVMIDSCVYHINKKDVSTVEEAIMLCSEYRDMDHEVQIFNDRNEGLIKNGRINGKAI